MTKREELEAAIRRYGEANFAAGDWDRNESEEKWDDVYAELLDAQADVDRLLKELT